jgi:drug/metabolite transporter (DMT)-like permease
MHKGILFIILSGLSFLVVNFLVKIMGAGPNQDLFPGTQKFPAHQLVLARSIVSFVLSAYILKRRQLPILGFNRKWLVIRGLSGMIALTIFFYTIHFLPLAIASTIQYLAPIFTVVFSMLFLKEKVRNTQWFFIFLAFIGVALIGFNNVLTLSKPSVVINYTWLGLGIISAAFSGIAYTAIIKLKATDTPINIVIYFPMLSLPIMTIWCLFEFVWPRGIEWFILLLIGIFTQIAQVLMTKALHEDASSVITPFQYLGAVYAAFIGFFIFDERLSFMVYIGMTLILCGVIFNTLLRKRKRKNGLELSTTEKH